LPLYIRQLWKEIDAYVKQINVSGCRV